MRGGSCLNHPSNYHSNDPASREVEEDESAKFEITNYVSWNRRIASNGLRRGGTA